MRLHSWTTVLAFFLLTQLHAQEKKTEKKWDVSNPEGPYKEVAFRVNEGTWMNLDLSPDGKEIVFDLLGDIYTMPVSGGEAKALRSGHAFEVQPRFSPDGKKILFRLYMYRCFMISSNTDYPKDMTSIYKIPITVQ